MFRRGVSRLAPGLAFVLVCFPLLALAAEPTAAGSVATGWPWDPDRTNVPSAERYPRPLGRTGNQRNVIAREDLGGWRTYLGDLHVHSRGHGEPTPTIQRDEVNLSAWYFGYDFLAITNHSTSWKLYDERAPLYRTLTASTSPEPPDLLALKGVESYLGPNDRAHFNAFNKLLVMDTDSTSLWHAAIASQYSADPLRSTHVQLNHPDPEDPWFILPAESDGLRRRAVRDAVELAEYTGLGAYFELLRRGFRVAPASNSDTHAVFRQDVSACAEPGPRSAWTRTYLPEPGVPPEKWRGEVLGGRTGIVLPVDSPFGYESLLVALRDRRVFRTSVPAASGFFVVNGYSMGSEFTLEPGERRLDFTIWATTRGGRGGGFDEWRRLEVWSPFREEPVYVAEFNDASLVSLRHALSLTPYESIYVVRLQQVDPEAEVLLAPVWITNPTARPRVTLDEDTVWRGDEVCLRVEGGGDALQLERADTVDAAGVPTGWRTVARVNPERENRPRCAPLDTGELPEQSTWRVVDAVQRGVTSNTVTLRVRR